ncbi:MAG: MBL fold metallo-hydrolase [Thermoplasmata archaeon]|nr:MBL fold metallo-hydrolase [Thermoplasmata archaeon]
MASITVYGGANEIGGNKILVESEETRIMLDFGARMGFESTFFSEFVDARTNTSLRDRLIIGAMPFIPGIYRSDKIQPLGWENIPHGGRLLTGDSRLFHLNSLITYEAYLQEHKRGYIDAMLLSHAHLDHTGDITYIHPAIPLYCSKVTEILVNAIDDVTSFPSLAITMDRPEIEYTKSGMFPNQPKISKKNKSRRDCITMANGQEESIGSIRVKAIDIDHSVPGASSFLLKTKSKNILYTGDIRFHGTSPISIDDYVAEAGNDIDVLICEGTRIDSESLITEDMVKQKIIDEMKAAKGLVFVDFSWKDTTRYETIRQASVECGRIFVINARLAYLLNIFGQNPDPNQVKVFLKRKSSALYSPPDYSNSKHEYGLSVDKENLDSTHYDNGMIALDIIANPGKYVVMASYYDFNQLFDFANDDGIIPDSRFIKAQCEPFSDDMELDEERMINWLEKFGIAFTKGEPDMLPGCTNPECVKIKRMIDRSHVSGHASRPELKELIEKLRPKTIIPVHTMNPGEFQKIAEEIKNETGYHIHVILPETGTKYEF